MEPLRQKIASEIILRSGILKKLEQGLVAPQSLINFFATYELTREDIYKSRVIRPPEFKEVIKRHGMAALANSLPQDHVLAEYLHEKQALLGDYLSSLSADKRIHPAEWEPKMRNLAVELYGRSECAVKALADHSFTLIDANIPKQAFRLFVDEGAESAVAYLERMKFSASKIDRMLEKFEKKHDEFTGESRTILTSQKEREIEDKLKKAGVFYRRQVPYKSVCNTDRRYFMDFLVGNTIIEVADLSRDSKEDFIHTPDYWLRILEKSEIAKASGKDFFLLSSVEDYHSKLEEIIATASTPAEAYQLREPIESPLIQAPDSKYDPRFRKRDRNAHFTSNKYQQGQARKLRAA